MNTRELFLGLLSAGLYKRAFRIKELPAEEEWEQLLKYSLQQNVLPIIYEQLEYSGIWDLAKELPSEEKAAAALVYQSAFQERAFQMITSQVQRTEIFFDHYEKMAGLGIRPVVVKGVICRDTYPEPDFRPSGDEDFFVTKDQYPILREFLLRNGFHLSEKSAEETMLEEIEFLNPAEGVVYEAHTSLMPGTSSFYDRHNTVFADAFERAVCVSVSGHMLYTLEPTQHLFFLLIHLLKHFIAGGVGIRQLCDILKFMEKNDDFIRWEEFSGWLVQFHLEIFWTNLMDIAISGLEFDPDGYGIPLYEDIIPDSGLILDDMFEAGIFGSTSMARMHSANMTIKAADQENAGAVGGVWSSLFPSVAAMRRKYPYLREKGYLLPAAYFQRIVRYLKNRDNSVDEKGQTAYALGRSRIQMLKKYGIVS